MAIYITKYYQILQETCQEINCRCDNMSHALRQFVI